ncbi:LOW QUALITY PROTEIN: uncharacterized protein [Amphiura filiformis]|uniref:LOW QUALITY PROTEIN: uncharacterized protein n=1 Tax=Amphiura filiformis TaxID=82378 RepID=UPI003B21C6C5
MADEQLESVAAGFTHPYSNSEWSDTSLLPTDSSTVDMDYNTTCTEMIPYAPPIYGPQLPGLEAGNSSGEIVHSTSPVPTNFMAADAEVHSTDVRDSQAVRGMCGLRNMGNTCFMNSGLQCLMHNTSLCSALTQCDKCPEESLSGKFQQLLHKVWSGEFAVLHPSQFKDTLGFMHGQFKDFRQHDGQEFLALLLDTLHEEMNLARLKTKRQSPFEDISEESSDSQYMSEASTSKLSELETLDIDSNKDEPISTQNNKRVVVEHMPSTAEEGDDGVQETVKLPSIEEFYMKDMKTLNTNMLQGEDPPSPVTTGSEKFPKTEKSPVSSPTVKSPIRNRVENPCESLWTSPPKNKKTNLLVAKKKGNLKPEGEDEGGGQDVLVKGDEKNETDAINRMKMDSSEQSAILGKLYKEGLPTAFHNYTAFSATEVTGKEAFYASTDSKLMNKLFPDGDVPVKALSTDEEMAVVKAEDGSCIPLCKLSKLQCSESKNNGVLNTDNGIVSSKLNSDNGKLNTDNGIVPGKLNSDNGIVSGKLNTDNGIVSGKLNTDNGIVSNNLNPERDVCVSPSKEVVSFSQELVDDMTHKDFVPNNQQALLAEACGVKGRQGRYSGRRELEDEGDKEWEHYLDINQSCIVDTFQGQFKSTVVCEVCSHLSIIYEPFMYLPVPLPRAMEKQLIMTWIPCHGQVPIRYLVCLNRLDSVSEMRREVSALVYGSNKPEDKEIILAEVFDNHISKILEDGVQLRYINDCFRLLYAFETIAQPQTDYVFPVGAMGVPHTISSSCEVSASSSTTKICSPDFELTNMSTQSDDVITQVGDAVSSFEDVGCSWDVMTTSEPSSTTVEEGRIDANAMSSEQVPCAAEGTTAASGASGDVFSNMSYFDSSMIQGESGDASRREGTAPEQSSENADPCKGGLQASLDPGSLDLWKTTSNNTSPWADDNMYTDSGDVSNTGAVVSQWQSCAICLEDFPEHNLLTHKSCGGMLCHACIERAVKHYGDQPVDCPVCRQEINPTEDYVAMITAAVVRPAKRILQVPVMFRNDTEEANGDTQSYLFGHPNVIYTLNEVSGEQLYGNMENLLPVGAPFTLVLTNGQGLQCSRCPYGLHCKGCQLVREVDLTLQSDDHLTVVFRDLPKEMIECASRVYDDKTMDSMVGNDQLTLRDCFQAFTESELLDEHNPWFCPNCKKPQCARKTIAIRRFPETLIVYLKRFVFHQFTSTKLDNKVLFQIESLDVSEFLCHEAALEGSNHIYDLQSAVCHFGGVNAGHYTSYVKNPLTNTWQYCNDETVNHQEPTEADSSNVYILFYQKKGTSKEFTPPTLSLDDPALQPSPAPPSSLTGEMDESCPPLAGEIEEPCVEEEQQSPAMEQSDIDRLLAGLNKAAGQENEEQAMQQPSSHEEEEGDKESFNFYQ